MSDPIDEESGSYDLTRETDARCAEFEQAWTAGKAPRLEDFLSGVVVAERAPLLRGLLTVELEHRRTSDGDPLTEQQLIDAHPKLGAELKGAFEELRKLGTRRVGHDQDTIRLPKSVVEQQRTIDHTPSHSESHGLHIRCPHCSNAVELLADTPYADINCSTCGSTFSLVDREDATQMATPLKRIDRFDLVSRLGVGGFGTVWKARDRELDRVVAIKMPRRGQLGPAEIEQFFREARSAAQLRHRHIVPVHEVGRDGETLFIVSDIVRGVSLSDWLTGYRPIPLEVVELCAKVADALAHAHEQGVIHRDLKPSNIMIDEAGEPFLMDFGLAKREVGEITMTADGQILGTPAYMSPEQARGESHWTDRRTDIYSLGIMLFEMLTGELPFRGNHQMQIHQRLTEDPPDPRKLSRHIPRDLATICLKCMEREPGRRYSTAAELRDEFQRYLKGEPILARPLSTPARAVRWTARNPLLASTAALITFLAIAGPLAALMINRQRDRLADLVVEKNNLIGRQADEKQVDTGKIADLSGQLDVWEGRANPWEFWPPKRDEPPRRKVLETLYQHANLALAGRQDNPSYDSDDQARSALGLAIIAEAIGRKEEATALNEEARERLQLLRQQSPDEPQLIRALAECDTALARLKSSPDGAGDRATAFEHIQIARAAYERLAAQNSSDISRQVEWLESELSSATLAGFEPGLEHLKNVADIYRSMPNQLPSNPTALYRLACFLTQREPILATSLTETAPPEDTPAP
ncbi:MAG: serine/threonine-protein kinase [Aeoliella sp.]